MHLYISRNTHVYVERRASMKRKHLLFGLALSLALGTSVASGILVSKSLKQDVVAANAYGSGDTNWFITGDFNSWAKRDPDAHMTFSQMAGNNWQFDTDYPIKLEKDSKFQVVYAWADDGYNKFNPSADNDYFYSENDYYVAKQTFTANFYFQVYGEGASWTGIYYAIFDAPAFAFKFTDEFNSICEANKNNAVGIAAPQAIADEWTRQTKLFGYLTDANKLLVKNANSESGTELANFAPKYDYIISKYTGLSNFADRTVTSPFESRSITTINSSNAGVSAIVAVSAMVSITAVGGFFLLKKKPF